jgi:hypothetical protein
MIFVAVSNAQTVFDIPKEVGRYERFMKEMHSSAKPVSLESIFEEKLLISKILTETKDSSLSTFRKVIKLECKKKLGNWKRT